MRQRITFIHKPGDAIDPYNIAVGKHILSISGLQAVREDKITFSFDSLPQDLQHVLQNSHELHIRYVKDVYHARLAPLLATVSPGLHAYYSPRRDAGLIDENNLCPLLARVFGIEDHSLCQSTEKSFTHLPSQRFQHSTTHSYYLPASNLGPYAFTDYLSGLCPAAAEACASRIPLLSQASSFDIDYDAVSHVLSLTVLYPHREWTSSLTLPRIASGMVDRVEVGLLSAERALEPEEHSLGGFLTIVGEDDKPSPTLFSFPSRHHSRDAHFSTSFNRPTGLHPTLRITISDTLPPEKLDAQSCRLHAYLTLPKTIFADKYQFNDALFLASRNLTALHYSSSPVDLEAPAYTTSLWGSSILLELAQAATSFEIPLHARYLNLSTDGSGYGVAEMPEPVVFWACTAEEGSKFSVNPFDRVNLGYDGLFGPRTMFYHLAPRRGEFDAMGGADADGYLRVRLPVMDLGSSRVVEVGTSLAVLAGFAWICWQLLRSWQGDVSRSSTAKQAVRMPEPGTKKTK